MSPTEYLANSTTWQVLEQTDNPAATVLLGACLTHPKEEMRRRSLLALLAKNSEPANMLILSHWSVYDQQDYMLLRQHAQQLSKSVRILLSQGTMSLKEMMLNAIHQLDLCEGVDVLLELAVNTKHPLNEPAKQCLLSLCRTWGHASRIQEAAPGDSLTESGPNQHSRGYQHRPNLLKMLYQELMRYPNSELIMLAWLSVVHWEDGLQRGLLTDTQSPIAKMMIKTLASTDDSAALQLLAGYLSRPTTPASVISALCEQPNSQFAVELAKLASDGNLESVRLRLLHCQPLRCMKLVKEDQLQLDASTYRKLLLLKAASNEDPCWVLAKSTALAKGTSSEQRRLANEILEWSRPISVEKVVSLMQDDITLNDGQLIYKHVHEMLMWFTSPSVALRKAAASFFAEFTVENLIKQTPLWPARMCRVLAEIVNVVDKNKESTLTSWLVNPSPKKRMDALKAIEYLECTAELSEPLIALLNDPKIEIRVRVIELLSGCGDDRLQQHLPALLADASSEIVDAAERAADRFKQASN